MKRIMSNTLKLLRQVIGSVDPAEKVERKGVEVAKIYAIKVIFPCQLEVRLSRAKKVKKFFQVHSTNSQARIQI